ncbi:uncharacterized protein LACBIDRAFT_311137 [Laccaria bicolor S238N-H82]|uniref:Predicted protein n=1 Tax=Laccaria bicolor (strain S238N-H82 / ATCC MYA-4686) TaxID=486041 RepID=B0CZB9_LACBS|nr:uncharacterized protein LACBIDRAFT_311137 [Laccaria bicolor S238N-H82]EDR12592.1 predicted protein [Laccaria bicolor S238N-H82]|eukprot:XP_001876856.1 predicted protein [Laccaria bicolor S238N-H82]
MHSYASNYRPTPDSRVTSTRRSSATSYLARPCVDSRMIAKLPKFEIQSHRIVQLGEEVWELWSPNAQQLPFLPGLLEDHFSVDIASRRSDRRSDGHLGRFDACVSPQFATGHPSWAPHIKRVPTSLSECPEFACILDVTDSRSSIHTNYIRELQQRNSRLEARIENLRANSRRDPSITLEDVWKFYNPNLRPDDISDLRSIRSFDKALDDVTLLQRKFKLKAAWIDWVERQQTTTSWSRSTNRLPEMADESYMGCWINGQEEEEIDWLLAHRIPCFIVHKLMGDKLDRLLDAGRGPKHTSFVRNTPIENLSSPHNRIETFLRRQRVIITESDNDDNIGNEEPSDPPEALYASFSLFHKEWSRGGPAPIAYAVIPNPTPPTQHASSTSPLLGLDFSSYGADPLDMVEVDPRRVAWIRPPPVMSPLKGKWEKWVEKNVEGELFVTRVGRSYADFHGVSYFDRSRNREIILLSDAPILPGAISKTEIFGLPCPRHLHFAEVPQNKTPRPAKASSWLYLTKDPTPGDVGMQARRPHAEDLPFKDEFRTGASTQPSPPPSPGNPAPPPLPLLFNPLDSPEIGGVPDSERPVSPVDSLLGSPPEVDWGTDLDEPMGPHIPSEAAEDVEMGTVDLGDVPSPLRSLPKSPTVPPPTVSVPKQPSPTPSPRHRAAFEPSTSAPAPGAPRWSPSRRGGRKHARPLSRSPTPPRRRGDSYRPRPSHNVRESNRPRFQPPTPTPNAWSTSNNPSSPWVQLPNANPWSGLVATTYIMYS